MRGQRPGPGGLALGHVAHLGGAVGPIYVEKLLARGAYGAVYAVSSRHLGGGHVLKCIDLRHQPRRAVVREVGLQRLAASPYTIGVAACTFTARHAYLLFEQGRGGSIEQLLAQRLAGGRPLDLHVLMRWFGHILGALTHCHARGIVHRDIKPENFVLSGATGTFLEPSAVAKLTDFGLATTSLHPGHAAGTLTYMAPELVAGQHATVASDLWALGTSLYCMLVGIEPFYDDTPERITARILRWAPQYTMGDLHLVLRARHTSSTLAAALVAAVSALLHHNPRRRRVDAARAACALSATLAPTR